MRKVGRAGSQLPTSVSRDSSYLSVSYAHPRWLVERWVAFFSHDIAQKICEYDQRIPATVLRLSSAEDETTLAAQGIQLAPGALMATARVVTSGDASATQMFREGQVLERKFAIQDEGSQLVAALVGTGRRARPPVASLRPGWQTFFLRPGLRGTFESRWHRLKSRLAPSPSAHRERVECLGRPAWFHLLRCSNAEQ